MFQGVTLTLSSKVKSSLLIYKIVLSGQLTIRKFGSFYFFRLSVNVVNNGEFIFHSLKLMNTGFPSCPDFYKNICPLYHLYTHDYIVQY